VRLASFIELTYKFVFCRKYLHALLLIYQIVSFSIICAQYASPNEPSLAQKSTHVGTKGVTGLLRGKSNAYKGKCADSRKENLRSRFFYASPLEEIFTSCLVLILFKFYFVKLFCGFS
jgi:hypothetical protein